MKTSNTSFLLQSYDYLIFTGMSANTCKLNSLNARGIGNLKKMKMIFTWCRKQKSDFIFLQETHSKKDSETCWKNEWGSEIIMAHGSSLLVISHFPHLFFLSLFQFAHNLTWPMKYLVWMKCNFTPNCGSHGFSDATVTRVPCFVDDVLCSVLHNVSNSKRR